MQMFQKTTIALLLTVWSCLMLMLVFIFWLDAMVYKPEPNPDIAVGLRTVIFSAHMDWMVKSLPLGCIWLRLLYAYLQQRIALKFSQVPWNHSCVFSTSGIVVHVRMTLWSMWAPKVIDSRCSFNKLLSLHNLLLISGGRTCATAFAVSCVKLLVSIYPLGQFHCIDCWFSVLIYRWRRPCCWQNDMLTA